MGTLAERLKDERKRLGLKQEEFAAAAGLNRTAQIRYEKGGRSPDAAYLAAVAGIGVDVAFVITGVPSPALGSDEALLLRRYRSASPEVRAAILAGLGAAVATSRTDGVSISGGEQGQVIAGNANQDGLTINVGGKKRGPRK